MLFIDRLSIILFLLFISAGIYYFLFFFTNDMIVNSIMTIIGIFSFILCIFQFFKMKT